MANGLVTVDIRQPVLCSALFTDQLTGALIDPSNVYFQFKSHYLGVVTTLHYGVDVSLIRVTTGTYYYVLDTTPSDGPWSTVFYSTGTGAAALATDFFVRPNPAIASVPRIDPTTYAALPVASVGNAGSIRSITDSTTTTWGATASGGGASYALLWCNGTTWTVIGK